MKKVILFGLSIVLVLSACSTTRQKLSPQANLNLKSANVYYAQKDNEASLKKAHNLYDKVLAEFPTQITALKRTADINFYDATIVEPLMNDKNGVKEITRIDGAPEAIKLYSISYGKYDSLLTVMNTFTDLNEDERLMKRDAGKKKDGCWVRIFKIGQILFDNKDYDQAIKAFEITNKLDPAKVEPLKMLVASYQEKKDEAKTELYINKVLAIAPNDAGMIKMMGAQYYKKDDFANALKYFKQTMEIAPLDINNHLLMANSYAGLKDYKSALESINRVLKLQPDDLDALNFAKNLAVSLEDKDASINYMTRIVALDSSIENLEVYCYMMQKYEMFDGLMDYAERWFDKDPTNIQAVQMCFTVAGKIGRPDLVKKYTTIYNSLNK